MESRRLEELESILSDLSVPDGIEDPLNRIRMSIGMFETLLEWALERASANLLDEVARQRSTSIKTPQEWIDILANHMCFDLGHMTTSKGEVIQFPTPKK